MRVHGRDRDAAANSAPNVDWIATAEQLTELLARSDFVVVACPLSDATRGMIGGARASRA